MKEIIDKTVRYTILFGWVLIIGYIVVILSLSLEHMSSYGSYYERALMVGVASLGIGYLLEFVVGKYDVIIIDKIEARKVTISRINDQVVLAEIVNNDAEIEIRKFAASRINDQVVLAEIVNSAPEIEVIKIAVSGINDQVVLAEIVNNVSEIEVRKIAEARNHDVGKEIKRRKELEKKKEQMEKEREQMEKEKQQMRKKALKSKWGRVPISGNPLKNALNIIQSGSKPINDMWRIILNESGHPILEEVLKRWKRSVGFTGFTDIGGVALFLGGADNNSLRLYGNEVRQLLLEALVYLLDEPPHSDCRTNANAASALGRVGSTENIPMLEHALKLALIRKQENSFTSKKYEMLIREIKDTIFKLSS